MKLINFLTFKLMMFVRWFMTKLPEQGTYRAADWLGRLSYYLIGRNLRELALSNLEMALGDQTTAAERVTIFRNCLVNLAYTFAELLHMDRIMDDWQNRFEFEGAHLIEEMLARKKGMIVFGGHFGGWTMFKAIGMRFPPLISHAHVVIRPQRNPYLDQWLRRYIDQNSPGSLMINTRGSGDLIEQVLQRGHLVGMFMDQESRRAQGVFVQFFGRMANSHVVPAYLSRKLQVPMFPFWIPRTRPGHFKIIYREPIPIIDTGDTDADIKAMTQLIAQDVERTIREHPEQWLWLHSRWKRQPEGEQASASEKKSRQRARQRGDYISSKDVKQSLPSEPDGPRPGAEP